MKKRGQVTLYIILGIIILIGILMYFYITAKAKEIPLEPVLDEVPEHFKKVQTYVLECVDYLGAEAVRKIGEGGGYIDPENTTLRPFNLNRIPTESDVLYTGPSHPVPYWWHLKSQNNCHDCEISLENIPSADEMEQQIAAYVDSNMAGCLAGFEPLLAEGFEIEETDIPHTVVEITPETVVIQTNLPLSVEKGSSDTRLENFGERLDAPLGNMYGLASYVVSLEAQDQFLESILMNMITSFSGLDSSKLPPIAAFDTGSSRVTWLKPDVELTITDLLKSYIGMIQVDNTKGARRLVIPDIYEQAFFDNLYLENNVSLDISASFIYMDWPFYFDITPRNGNLLGPSSYRNEFPNNMVTPIETQHYEFFYDVSYPVLVELRDDSALGGRGLSFLFALEGNVRDNRNSLEWHMGEGTMGEWDYGRVSLRLRDSQDPEYLVFDPYTNSTYNATFEPPAKSLLCDNDQKIGSELRLRVINAKNQAPLKDASVAFSCGRDCLIGSSGYGGILETQLPVCIGGHLKIDKDGYLGAIIPDIRSMSGSGLNLEASLEPVRLKKATAKTIRLTMVNSTSNYTERYVNVAHGLASPLGFNENVMVTLTRQKRYSYEQDFFQSIVFGVGEEDIRLVPGNYSVQVMYLDNDGVYIPARNEFIGDQLIKYPPVEMKPAMLGNINIDASTGGYWEVTSADLEKGYVTFYALVLPKPKTIEDMDEMANAENHSIRFRPLLIPEFS